MRSRAARTDGRADGNAIDCQDISFGQTGCRAVTQMDAVGVEQQNRAARAVFPLSFDALAQRIENFGQGRRLRDEFENPEFLD